MDNLNDVNDAVCPHCERKITEQDLLKYRDKLKDTASYQEFRKTHQEELGRIAKSAILKISGIMIFLVILPVIGLVLNTELAFYVFNIFLVFYIIVILVCFKMAFSIDKKQHLLFERFKKGKTA